MEKNELHQAKKNTENEFRCFSCDKLLARKGTTVLGLEIKCVRCGNLNFIFDDTNEMVFFTDSKGVIFHVNDYCKDLTGYDSSEVIGKTPAIWGGQMSPDFYQDLWQRILTEKKSVAVHVTNKRKDGALFEALVRISPILDEQGAVHVFFGRVKLAL